MSKPDGGPAFPVTQWNNDLGERELCGGMSLRDHFASCVLSQLSLSPGVFDLFDDDERAKYADCAAEFTYEIADAMLRARSKPRA